MEIINLIIQDIQNCEVQKHTYAWTYLWIDLSLHERTCAWTYICIKEHLHNSTCAWTYQLWCAGFFALMQNIAKLVRNFFRLDVIKVGCAGQFRIEDLESLTEA